MWNVGVNIESYWSNCTTCLSSLISNVYFGTTVHYICYRVQIALQQLCRDWANLEATSEGNEVCLVSDCQQVQTPSSSPTHGLGPFRSGSAMGWRPELHILHITGLINGAHSALIVTLHWKRWHTSVKVVRLITFFHLNLAAKQLLWGKALLKGTTTVIFLRVG